MEVFFLLDEVRGNIAESFKFIFEAVLGDVVGKDETF